MDALDAIDDNDYETLRFSDLQACPSIRTDGLGIFHMNIGSLNSKFNDLVCLINENKPYIDILVLSECWFNINKQIFTYHINLMVTMHITLKGIVIDQVV
uniref:Uncharacterized protein n=1 Tax=Cacopsylla melanoneura TaxID=428564 RepID=A0A8D9EZ62_9HEMI